MVQRAAAFQISALDTDFISERRPHSAPSAWIVPTNPSMAQQRNTFRTLSPLPPRGWHDPTLVFPAAAITCMFQCVKRFSRPHRRFHRHRHHHHHDHHTYTHARMHVPTHAAQHTRTHAFTRTPRYTETSPPEGGGGGGGGATGGRNTPLRSCRASAGAQPGAGREQDARNCLSHRGSGLREGQMRPLTSDATLPHQQKRHRCLPQRTLTLDPCRPSSVIWCSPPHSHMPARPPAHTHTFVEFRDALQLGCRLLSPWR